MCGVDSTKFNAITALVYNPNTDSGFTKEFDDYRKTDDIAKDAMDFINLNILMLLIRLLSLNILILFKDLVMLILKLKLWLIELLLTIF